jgi:hypothetical protein
VDALSWEGGLQGGAETWRRRLLWSVCLCSTTTSVEILTLKVIVSEAEAPEMLSGGREYHE